MKKNCLRERKILAFNLILYLLNLALILKDRDNRKTLPREYLIVCQSVKKKLNIRQIDEKVGS